VGNKLVPSFLRGAPRSRTRRPTKLIPEGQATVAFLPDGKVSVTLDQKLAQHALEQVPQTGMPQTQEMNWQGPRAWKGQPNPEHDMKVKPPEFYSPYLKRWFPNTPAGHQQFKIAVERKQRGGK